MAKKSIEIEKRQVKKQARRKKRQAKRAKKALPLAWVTYKGRKGHSSQQMQLQLFKRVKALLPVEVPVILLGDGEFDGSEVIDWFQQGNP